MKRTRKKRGVIWLDDETNIDPDYGTVESKV
jgi:hypothetical protein